MKSLELYAMEWLRYEKRCAMVLTQRTPTYSGGVPDVVGVLGSRKIIEIEVKRTLADFKLNFKKRHIQQREQGVQFWLERSPYQFYFLVPFALVCKVEHLVPKWAGLMHAPSAFHVQQLYVIKKAPTNKHSQRMTFGECIRSVSLMTNQAIAQQNKINQLQERIKQHEQHEQKQTD